MLKIDPYLIALFTEIPARIITAYTESIYSRIHRYWDYCEDVVSQWGAMRAISGEYTQREMRFFYPDEMPFVRHVTLGPSYLADIQTLAFAEVGGVELLRRLRGDLISYTRNYVRFIR